MSSIADDKYKLVRGLGLIAAVSVIIGNVIGTGVFFKARIMTCNVGSPEWVLIAWIAAGLLSLAGALTYAELTAMKPEASGEYVFLRDAYGRLSSFLFGWMQMFIAKPGSQAAAGLAFAVGLNGFIGDNRLGNAVFLETSLVNISMIQVVALMMIVIFTTLNAATVAISGQIATILTGVKIVLILFVGVGAFIFVTGDFSHFSQISNNGTCADVAESATFGTATYSFAAGFGAAMLGALWGYDGWNNLTFVAGEVKQPGRNIPLAIIGSTILIIFLYVFVHVGYFYVLDPTAIASVSVKSSVGEVIVSRFFGGDVKTFAVGFAVTLFTIGLMLSSLGTLHTSILSGSRVPYAMAKDGLMFKQLGKLSATNVPVSALIVQGIFASMLVAISGSFDSITDYVVFGSWIFYALVTSSIFVFRRRYPDAVRPYKAWGYPVVPVLFLFVAGWLLINTFYTALPQITDGLNGAWTGLATLDLPLVLLGMKTVISSSPIAGSLLIMLGLPVYYILESRGNKKIGEQDDESKTSDR